MSSSDIPPSAVNALIAYAESLPLENIQTRKEIVSMLLSTGKVNKRALERLKSQVNKEEMSTWTRWYLSKPIQNLSRGYNYNTGKKVKKDITGMRQSTIATKKAMNRYFSSNAPLRAPVVPPGENNGLLYRAVYLTERQYEALITRGAWSDNGYMSFAKNERDAKTVIFHPNRFLHQVVHQPLKPVIFILPMTKVPPNTPWVWYDPIKLERRDTPLTMRVPTRPNQMYSRNSRKEVLLPPGNLHVMNMSSNRSYITRFVVRYTRRHGKGSKRLA